MNEPDSRQEVIALLMQAREPDSTAEMREQLNARLREDAAAREIVSRYLADEASLVLSLKSESIAAFVAEDSAVLPGESAARGRSLRAAVMASRWRMVAVAAVIALLAGITTMMLPDKDRTILRLAELNGSFRWTGNGGRVVDDLESGAALAGGTLDALTSDASAVLVFHDGSRVTVSGQASLTVADFGQKVLRLQSGVLSAEVVKQPKGQPMRILTPSAETEVVGTRLNVDADMLSTRVTVNEGRVRVTRLADGTMREVAADQLVVAKLESRTPFEVKPRGEHTDSWRSTLPKDVRYGKWLPSAIGGPGLVSAEPQMWKPDAQTDPVLQHFALLRVSSGESPPAWLSADSRIRVRGRLQSSQAVFFGFTAHHAKGGFAGRYVTLRQIEVGSDDGRSFDIEIPVSTFKKGEPNFPASPIGGELYDWFAFTRQGDVGLKIESVELVR